MKCDIVTAVTQYAAECFRLTTSPRVDELARKLSVHPSFLSRHFKATTGRSLSDVFKEYQVEEAKRLLSQTSLAINEIAIRAGFGTRNTFFRCFKRVAGTTPHSYRSTMHTTTANVD